MGKVSITTAATEQPITTAEAKAHLNIDSDYSADDTLISAMIKAATNYAQAYCRRLFVATTVTEYYDNFPASGSFELSYGVITLSSVKYKDSNNTEQTWNASNYEVDNKITPAKIQVLTNKSYPSTYDGFNAVYVEYITGFGAASDVPQDVKHALLLMVADMYDNREDKVKRLPTASQMLLNSYQIVQL